MNERFYLLKIQLLDIEPVIWRRFAVPASITLDRLHDVIQIVMGWTDSHLHEFTIGNPTMNLSNRIATYHVRVSRQIATRIATWQFPDSGFGAITGGIRMGIEPTSVLCFGKM